MPGPEWSPTETKREVIEYAAETDGLRKLRQDGGDGLFDRLKLVGMYHQKQEGYFMFRTKIPAGVLTADQAEAIGEVACDYAHGPEANDEWGQGFVDLTTRQDTQKHWLQLEEMPDVWSRYEDVGLTSMQACGNSVRNVVGCPASSLTEDDVEVQSVVEEISDYFAGHDRYANLPRKLKVSVNGCRHRCAETEINDIGFTLAEKDGELGFNVHVGGGLSDAPRMADPLDAWVEPQQAVEVVRGLAEAFIELGSYPEAAVNRIRFLVEEHGVERIRREIGSHLDFDLPQAGDDLRTEPATDHVGVHRQSDGDSYVGLNVTAGRLPGDDLVEFSKLARRYGSGDLRLTTNQNLLIPDVSDSDLDALLEEPLLSRYSPDPGPFSRGVVTCTGREFCSFGVVETKNRARRWAEELDDTAAEDVDDVFRLHFSGCKASCAQPQIGDVGLRGASHRNDEDTGEAADVGLGGGLDDPAGFADWLVPRVPIDEIPDAIRRLSSMYSDSDADSFKEYCRNTPEEQLHDVVADEEVAQ